MNTLSHPTPLYHLPHPFTPPAFNKQYRKQEPLNLFYKLYIQDEFQFSRLRVLVGKGLWSVKSPLQ